MHEQLSDVDLYADTRQNLVGFIRSLPEDQLNQHVPATPEWTVFDVIAHQVGVAADFMNGHFPGRDLPFAQWTQNQVGSRRGRSRDELVREWDEICPQVTEMIADAKIPVRPLVNDQITHEQDLRCMFGVPGGTSTSGFAYCMRLSFASFDDRIKAAELPALTVKTPRGTHAFGEGDPSVALEISDYELLRALFGRRSRPQMSAFKWTGNGAPYIALIPVFGPTDTDLIESF
jgi:uncharacterized protein (TIGR03083 family)